MLPYSRHTPIECSFKTGFSTSLITQQQTQWLVSLSVNILYMSLEQVVDSQMATAKTTTKNNLQSASKSIESDCDCQTEKAAVWREVELYYKQYLYYMSHM